LIVSPKALLDGMTERRQVATPLEQGAVAQAADDELRPYTHANTYSYSRRRAAETLRALAPTVPASPYVLVNAHPRRGHALRRGGKPLPTRSIFRIVRDRVSPLVGRPVSPHTLRHTFGSVLAERGASPFAVQRTMGHSRLETTGNYVHLSGETLRDEIETHLG